MTLTDPSLQTAPVVWVQQQPDLWTGRRGGRPIGTIERGRRFVYVTTDSVPHSGHRSLSAAQAAASSGRNGMDAPGVSRLERLLAAAATVAAVSTVALSTAAVVIVH